MVRLFLVNSCVFKSNELHLRALDEELSIAINCEDHPRDVFGSFSSKV
jgi:hypothetical protein